jgi:hypothetical protein
MNDDEWPLSEGPLARTGDASFGTDVSAFLSH